MPNLGKIYRSIHDLIFISQILRYYFTDAQCLERMQPALVFYGAKSVPFCVSACLIKSGTVFSL